MLFNGNPYQHSIYLTSANAVSSSIYGMSTGITGYFNLRDINEDLQHRNSDLELELLNLKATLRKYQEVDYAMSTPVDSSLSRYNFIIAHVINNSVNRPHNFITIEKGSEDGIKPEMGVVDQNGVVGKINVDEEPDLARAYRVMSIPTLVVVKDGEVVKRNVGALSKKDAVGMIETFL